MKKLLFLTICSLFFLISFVTQANASITYTRTPTGNLVTFPVTFNVSVDDFSDFGFSPDVNVYRIDLEGDYADGDFFGTCFASTTLSISQTLNQGEGDFEIGDRIKGVYIDPAVGSEDPNDCDTWTRAGIYIEGQPENTENPIITFVSGVPSKILNIATASSSDILASTGTLITDLWQILAIVIGIPLTFYVIPKIIAFFPF